jgi:exodeoxyribonuclease VII small subunit
MVMPDRGKLLIILKIIRIMSKKERLGFEEALKRLEAVVDKLNDQDISLEESVELYEEGIKLSKICSETLESAVLKIEQIDQSNGKDPK